jgi:hypothetical protein
MLKFSFSILKFKKYRVCRFIHSPVRVIDKFPHGERFFSPCGKNLSEKGDKKKKEEKKCTILVKKER